MADAATVNVSTSQQHTKKKSKNKKKTQTLKTSEIESVGGGSGCVDCESSGSVTNGIAQANGKMTDKCIDKLLEELHISSVTNGGVTKHDDNADDAAAAAASVYNCQNGHEHVDVRCYDAVTAAAVETKQQQQQHNNNNKNNNNNNHNNNRKEQHDAAQQQRQQHIKAKNKTKHKEAQQFKQQQQQHCHKTTNSLTTIATTTTTSSSSTSSTSSSSSSLEQIQNQNAAAGLLNNTELKKPIENGNATATADIMPSKHYKNNAIQSQKKANKKQQPAATTETSATSTSAIASALTNNELPVDKKLSKNTAKSEAANTAITLAASTNIQTTTTTAATTATTAVAGSATMTAVTNAAAIAAAAAVEMVNKLRPIDVIDEAHAATTTTTTTPTPMTASISSSTLTSESTTVARNALAQLDLKDNEVNKNNNNNDDDVKHNIENADSLPSTSAAARKALEAQTAVEQMPTIVDSSKSTTITSTQTTEDNSSIPNTNEKASTSPSNERNNGELLLDITNVHIDYTEYEAEHQMHDIMRLIQAELSEPYSIYTYRYFIYNWPKLCFLARHGNEYVGAIVCKLDMHLNVRRGYIAMLAVRKEYRKLKIGTTLVSKAIEAMLADNADEVVLETEMRNVPALRLYENLGFVRDKRLFRYYLNGVDALRLKLWFR